MQLRLKLRGELEKIRALYSQRTSYKIIYYNKTYENRTFMRKQYFFQSKNDILRFLYFVFEFSIVFLMLILPPMLSSKQTNEVSLDFKLFYVIFFSITSIFLYFLVYSIPFSSDYLKKDKKPEKYSFSLLALTFIFILILNSLFSILQKDSSAVSVNITQQDIKSKILLITQIFILACYEEILYRKYITNRIVTFMDFFHLDSQIFSFFAILISAILFSLAHRYRGFTACAFSFICALAFSLCYHFTKNIFLNFIVHFAYNLVVFFHSC